MEDDSTVPEAELVEWAAKVRLFGYRCERCGKMPAMTEREIFLQTGLCEQHAFEGSKK